MKAWNMIFIAISIMLVLTFLGFPSGAFGTAFEKIGFNYSESGEIGSITTSATDMVLDIFGTAGILTALALAGGALLTGIFARYTLENLILLPFIVGTLSLFISCFNSITNYAIQQSYPTWVTAVIVMIFLPTTAGLAIALIEFFRGTD